MNWFGGMAPQMKQPGFGGGMMPGFGNGMMPGGGMNPPALGIPGSDATRPGFSPFAPPQPNNSGLDSLNPVGSPGQLQPGMGQGFMTDPNYNQLGTGVRGGITPLGSPGQLQPGMGQPGMGGMTDPNFNQLNMSGQRAGGITPLGSPGQMAPGMGQPGGMMPGSFGGLPPMRRFGGGRFPGLLGGM
jgi:hypothetical protein